MGAREDADFRDDRTDLVEGATVNAVAVLDDVATQDLGLTFLEGGGEPGRLDAVRVLLGLHQRLGGLLLGGTDRFVAGVLGLVGIGGLDVVADQLLDRGDDVRVILGGEVERLLGGVFGQVDDGIDHRLHAAVREHQGLEEGVFRQFLGLGLDHHQGVLGAGHEQVEVGIRHLVQRRVQNQLAVDIADARAANRAHEGHTRDGQGGRGRDHADHVRVIFQIVLENGDDHLGLVLEALDEQGADRTVDQAGNQGFLLGRPTFTLEIAAGDAARGKGLFLIVDRQGEEIEAGLGRAAIDNGGQHHGLAIGGQNRAIRLTGDAARFQRQRASGPLDGLAFDIEHIFSFVSHGRIADGGGQSGLVSVLRAQEPGYAVASGRVGRGPAWPSRRGGVLPPVRPAADNRKGPPKAAPSVTWP